MPSASSYLNPKHFPVAACGPGEASGLSRLWGKLGGAEERVNVTCRLTFIQWRLEPRLVLRLFGAMHSS